jgi:hypothetical protein
MKNLARLVFGFVLILMLAGCGRDDAPLTADELTFRQVSVGDIAFEIPISFVVDRQSDGLLAGLTSTQGQSTTIIITISEMDELSINLARIAEDFYIRQGEGFRAEPRITEFGTYDEPAFRFRIQDVEGWIEYSFIFGSRHVAQEVAALGTVDFTIDTESVFERILESIIRSVSQSGHLRF